MKQFSTNAEKHRSTVAKKASDCETQVKNAKVTKPKWLSNTDVSEFLLEHNIKTENELMMIAKQRYDDSENGIYNFIVNKTQKALSEHNMMHHVSTTRKIQNAPAIVESSSKSRIEILNEYANTTCVENCNGEWFLCAKEVLKNNSINLYVYLEASHQCLKNGRQRQNNIMLVGPTNSGKSFLLDPLELTYKAFMNPSATSYGWVGLEKC